VPIETATPVMVARASEQRDVRHSANPMCAPAWNFGGCHHFDKVAARPKHPQRQSAREWQTQSSITRPKLSRSKTSKHACRLWRRQLEMADDENADQAASEA
jgi:hypothetical protein